MVYKYIVTSRCCGCFVEIETSMTKISDTYSCSTCTQVPIFTSASSWFLATITSESNFLLCRTPLAVTILYTLPSHQLAPKELVAQLVEHHTRRCECVGSNPTQVLRFSFPRKKILVLVYKCYRNELLMS